MSDTARVKQQFWALVLISALFFLGAPSVWHYTPDGGIYIGTAESIVETGQYRFNGYPNLHYYPGFSTLLSLPIMVFGINFHILHLFCAAMAVVLLWLSRAYFAYDRYGLTGILVPVLIACTGVVQYQAFRILSDGTFLAVCMAALLLWRIYVEESNRWALIACIILVAFAPMVRFQGLFLCFAFAVALFLRSIKKGRRSPLTVGKALAVGAATLIPFAAWTWRNVQQFTPHTFNMANAFFFGQKGLSLYAPGFGRVDWINAEWKYPLYSVAYSVRGLGADIFGKIGYWLPVEVVVIFIVGIACIGSLRWFKLATDMERVFATVCSLFALFLLVRSHSLYSTVRQLYLPFLPFILICGGLGLSLLYERLIGTRYRILSSAVIGFLVVLIVSSGVSQFFTFVSPSKSSYFENANQVIAKVKRFMDKDTNPVVPVATTDWGVMPFSLGRTCYQVLNDESHFLTLQRMAKYQTEYLVILDQLAVFPPYARKMVEDLPHLFNEMYAVDPGGDLPSAAVYRVDLESVQAFVDAEAEK